MDTTIYTTYDLPILYRNIKIYPVTVKDYLFFGVYSECLKLDKNSIPDVKIISMSDLEYIFYATQQNTEKEPYLLWFDRLLSLSLKDEKSFENMEESIQRYYLDSKGKPFFKIGEEVYDSHDFVEMRNIISEQNLVELPDFSISKEVRDSLEAARAYKRKLSGDKPTSLEDYMISLSVTTGWTLDSIYSMSIRKFTKSIRRLDNLIHYKIALAAGLLEKDSGIKHWLANLDSTDQYGDVTMSLEEVQGKLSLESAKN